VDEKKATENYGRKGRDAHSYKSLRSVFKAIEGLWLFQQCSRPAVKYPSMLACKDLKRRDYNQQLDLKKREMKN
jgi:hypothetical protein